MREARAPDEDHPPPAVSPMLLSHGMPDKGVKVDFSVSLACKTGWACDSSELRRPTCARARPQETGGRNRPRGENPIQEAWEGLKVLPAKATLRS